MPYIIRPSWRYTVSNRQWNVFYRRVFKGNLPEKHSEHFDIEVDTEYELSRVMNDIYQPRYARRG